MALRNWARAASRSWCQYRRQLSSYADEVKAVERHAQSTTVTWRRISLFVAIPVCGYLGWKMFKGEHGHEGAGDYIPWPHLRIRNKPFPWGDGDTTLFHNPHTNLGPEKPEQELKTKPTWRAALQSWWIENLFEDPDKRDEQRWKHLKKMQKRKEDYLRKKAAAIDKQVPVQPMDLFTEIKLRRPNPRDSGMEN